MAESIVNLTKFKRRVSNQQETVGGPIDVAVVTRGDGFVWLQRKHYFRPNLNPRVGARYTREKGKLQVKAYRTVDEALKAYVESPDNVEILDHDRVPETSPATMIAQRVLAGLRESMTETSSNGPGETDRPSAGQRPRMSRP